MRSKANKTGIDPAIFQPFLESAANAAAKGMGQFFTPLDWGQALAQPLPRYRPAIVDLNCGAGDLLKAARRPSTTSLLGCDIEAGIKLVSTDPPIQFVGADVTRLYSLLRAVDFRADCFVLNPPWDLHWYREPLAALTESDLPTVRAAFAAHDGRTTRDTIDSTVATLCLALDRSSDYGEGLLIANDSTLQRLILGPAAPHRALAMHAWAHLIIAGNPMTGLDNCAHQEDQQFQTGILYFARGHDVGCCAGATRHSTLEAVRSACAELQAHRPEQRLGPEPKSYAHTEDTADRWLAAAGEWERLHQPGKPQWNLSLRPDGTIRTNLSLFDTHSARVTKDQAAALFTLEGRRPMQLVLQRQERAALECAAYGTIWRVDPALQEAVKAAVAEYHRVRAPLYPLSPVQRLGYLDEVDEITCTQDFFAPGSASPCFRADHTYPLRSTTVAVHRSGEKLNLSGELDQVEWDGQELAFFIADEAGLERVFMDARLLAANVQLSMLRPGDKPGRPDRRNPPPPCKIDFALHHLVSYFAIPDVPDVARMNPEAYQRNLKLLQEIEELSA
jgi:hypothetical protein